MKFLGIHFAPLCVPLERRLQTLGAVAFAFLLLGGMAISWIIFFWLVIYSATWRVPCLLYGVWTYFDRGTIESGQRRYSWVRNLPCWAWFRDYFPVRLVKTAELPPDRSYLFATFPHGVLAIGAFSTFSTDSCHFDQIFPGLTPHTVTLLSHFITPFIREVALAMGSLPANEGIMIRKLSQKGNALCLLVGGAEEAFHSKPGEYNIVLARRKGFIRVALKSGASIVPTISFGEPEVYDHFQCMPGSFLRWTQDKWKQWTGIAPVYLKGRGMFQYTFGLLPRRSPVTVVAGRPIHVTKMENPTKSQIDELHAIYCEQLIELFNTESRKYLDKPTELKFLPARVPVNQKKQ